jgi:hypothetical protein
MMLRLTSSGRLSSLVAVAVIVSAGCMLSAQSPERNCRQTLSGPPSMTYESHKLLWMLPGESSACCGGQDTGAQRRCAAMNAARLGQRDGAGRADRPSHARRHSPSDQPVGMRESSR